MKPATKYRLYKAWMTVITFIPILLCIIPLCIVTPIEVAFYEICQWRGNKQDKMFNKLRLYYGYDRKKKKFVIKENNQSDNH